MKLCISTIVKVQEHLILRNFRENFENLKYLYFHSKSPTFDYQETCGNRIFDKFLKRKHHIEKTYINKTFVVSTYSRAISRKFIACCTILNCHFEKKEK